MENHKNTRSKSRNENLNQIQELYMYGYEDDDDEVYVNACLSSPELIEIEENWKASKD